MRGKVVLLLVQLSKQSHRFVSKHPWINNVLTSQKVFILDTSIYGLKISIANIYISIDIVVCIVCVLH